MKVLVSAYACDPGAGSEPGAGWSWARAAALAGHDVWLLTRENNRDPIEAALEAEPALSVRPVYLDLPVNKRRWKRGQRGVRLYYLLWQRLARQAIRDLHQTERFDIAHHLTFAIDWLPAGAVGVQGLPAVWGPVGGAGSVPVTLYRWLGLRGVGQELLRECVVRPLRRAFGDRNARAALLTVAQNHDVAARFAKTSRRVVVEPNVALDPASFIPLAPGRKDGATTVLFVGRLIPWKGLRLAIAALRLLPGHWSLVIIGDGPERRRCQRLAAAPELVGRVEFLGHVPRAQVLSAMAEADVLLLPSMHDSAGWVIGEAAAAGTPTVCLDLGGPATMVGRSGGLAVKPSGGVIEQLADALERALELEVERDAWAKDRLPSRVDSWYRYSIAPSSPGRAPN